MSVACGVEQSAVLPTIFGLGVAVCAVCAYRRFGRKVSNVDSQWVGCCALRCMHDMRATQEFTRIIHLNASNFVRIGEPSVDMIYLKQIWSRTPLGS